MIKRILKNTTHRFFKYMGYELIKTPVLPIKNQEDIIHVSLESVLAYPMLKNDDFFFVQIGAFDGISFDPIYPFIRKYGW
jgi:hypothetical protein